MHSVDASPSSSTVPSAHGVHEVVVAAKWPDSHWAHSVAGLPSVSANPGAQSVQLATPGAAYIPVPHKVHADVSFVSEYMPAAHDVQVASLAEAVPLE